MHNFKLIIAIMMSVIVMQLHGSQCGFEYREILDRTIQQLYTGPLREFIIASGKTKKDTRSEEAIILMTSLQQQRKSLYAPEPNIAARSRELLNMLQAYKNMDEKVTGIVVSKEFSDLQEMCKKIASVKK